MRTTFFILVLIASRMVWASNQQDSLRPKFGIELNSSASLSSLCITPTFTYSFGAKSKITFGIGTGLWNAFEYSGGKFSGIEFQVNYKYFPHGETNRVNFYFQGIMKHASFPYKSPQGYKEINHANEILLGYGLEVPIGKKIYILNDFAIGEVIFFETYSSGINFGVIIPNIYVKFGVGYRFGLQ
ncbi:MAG: hypothetical protein IPM74_05110 [Crocinitomicaceae bacterium]|nr:hypothetical protein [Crocinitomicaceae bacterium]MBK8925283.1 hypothetical protein [Crocinitomicaceae bacterium]